MVLVEVREEGRGKWFRDSDGTGTGERGREGEVVLGQR